MDEVFRWQLFFALACIVFQMAVGLLIVTQVNSSNVVRKYFNIDYISRWLGFPDILQLSLELLNYLLAATLEL